MKKYLAIGIVATGLAIGALSGDAQTLDFKGETILATDIVFSEEYLEKYYTTNDKGESVLVSQVPSVVYAYKSKEQIPIEKNEVARTPNTITYDLGGNKRMVKGWLNMYSVDDVWYKVKQATTTKTDFDTKTSGVALAASVGPTVCASNSSGGGDTAWTNVGNVFSSDNIYTVAPLGRGDFSGVFSSVGCGFSVPFDATIDGIVYTNEHKAQSISDINELVVSLLKAGSPVGDNKASATSWPTSDSTVNYGGATDLWGTTWTPTDVNGAGFGSRIQVENTDTGNDVDASMDYLAITIYYTETAPPPAGADYMIPFN